MRFENPHVYGHTSNGYFRPILYSFAFECPLLSNHINVLDTHVQLLSALECMDIHKGIKNLMDIHIIVSLYAFFDRGCFIEHDQK